MSNPLSDLDPRHSRGRVAIGRILTAVLLAGPIRAVFDFAIRVDMVRRLLNRAYDRWGARSLGVLFRKMYPPELTPGEFLWRHTAATGTLRFPVSPSLAQSWLYARLWSGPNYVPAKGLYAWYLEQRPTGVFFDIGANRGMMSYPLARAGYECYCFEPQPLCTDYIARVRDLNRLSTLRVVESAVSDEDRAGVEFFVSEATFLSSFIRDNVEAEERATAVTVPAVTVDTFCKTERLAPTLMKIDVEGWELQVLRGAGETLRTERPDMLIEIGVHSPRRAETWAHLKELGYRVYALPMYGDGGPRRMDSFEALTSAPTVDFFCTRDETLLVGGKGDET